MDVGYYKERLSTQYHLNWTMEAQHWDMANSCSIFMRMESLSSLNYAPCGNDEFIHQWTGNWKLGEDERTLILQIENYPVRRSNEKLRPSEAYKREQEFHIIEITKEAMQVQFKDPEIQLGAELL